MAFERFLEINFRQKTLVLIEQANEIIDEYQAEGFTLTVRQLYYQFVARDLVANTALNYERIASVVDDARKAGLIDWAAIEDRTRFLRAIPTFANPMDFLDKEIPEYAEDVWNDQDYYAEVWIEKDALLGVVERACMDLRVPYFAARGYPSSTALYNAGRRLARKRAKGQWPIIFYLGDHDPSGLQMGIENAPNALMQYARSQDIELNMVALTREQIDEHEPPANYAKESDSRYRWYNERTGLDDAWELDALPPNVVDQLLRDQIEAVLDRDKFDSRINAETVNRDKLTTLKNNFERIANNMPMIERYLDNRTPAIDSELLRKD